MKRESERREAQSSAGGGVSWMIVFADLCTLLLAFFVLILSMSSLNQKAFRNSFQKFGQSRLSASPMDSKTMQNPRDRLIQDIGRIIANVPSASFRNLGEVTDQELADPRFTLESKSGITVLYRKNEFNENFSFVLGEKDLFQDLGAKLNPEALWIIETLGHFLKESDYRIYIDGHSDKADIRGERFSSGYSLSIARAQAVLRYFVEHCAVSPERIALGAYGASSPLTGSRTSAERTLNRRIELIFQRAVNSSTQGKS